MDASQITKLLQKQNTRFINRCQTVDSSTLTWQNQIQSSKYIKGVKTCNGEQNWNVPTNPGCSVGNGICNFGGSGRTTSIQTGSPQQFLNVLSGASGSASQVYSSESILLQKAGKESCAVPSTNPAPQNSYVVLPACYCVDTNGPTASNSEQLNNSNPLPINNQSNPYLPPFDTYYAMKNPGALCKEPIQDQNQKHFVKQCHSRFPNANNGVNAVFNPSDNVTRMDPDTKQFYTYPTTNPDTCDGCIQMPETSSNYSISYNLGQLYCIKPNPELYPVVFSPGTPYGGIFTISCDQTPSPEIPPNPITVHPYSGLLTVPGSLTNPGECNYTVTYTVGDLILSWSYSFGFC